MYEKFILLDSEFSFTVDPSALECGMNGGLYFVEMDPTGDMRELNNAGATYGTGYCDSQCAMDNKFINGTANIEGWDTTR